MKNQSRHFATMSDDERRRFALEQGGSDAADAAEVNFDEPRDEDRMDPSRGRAADSHTDTERRDGAAAQLDDAAHDRAVRKQAQKRDREPDGSGGR